MTKKVKNVKMSKKSISEQLNPNIHYEEQMDIIAPYLTEFVSEFGEYMVDELELIKIETMVNYKPLLNHSVAVEMLTNDSVYDEISQIKTFDWKNSFLTTEQEIEHNDKMMFEFRDKCHSWLDNQKELLETFKLTYSNEDDYINLFDIFANYIWEHSFENFLNNK